MTIKRKKMLQKNETQVPVHKASINQLSKVFTLCTPSLPGMPLENSYTSYKGMDNIFMVS